MATLQIEPHEYAELCGILKQTVPRFEVRAFGSRVNGNAGKFSDIDIAVITELPLDVETQISLKDRFSDSNLPFTVDIVDWVSCDEKFRNIIEKNYIVIQEAERVD